MNLVRARILKADRVEPRDLPVLETTTPRPSDGELVRGKRVARAEVAARERAKQVLRDAEAQAERIVSEARRSAADLQLATLARTKADALAGLAALAIQLKLDERRALVAQREQSLQLARLLAERLLGAELALAPERIVALTQQVLCEARGARRLVIQGHPEDVHVLQQLLHEEGIELSFEQNPDFSRGDLWLDIEGGGVDARLACRLDRLVEKLRESLGNAVP